MSKKKTPSKRTLSTKTYTKKPRTSKSVLWGTILLVLSMVFIVFIMRQDDLAGFGIGGFLLFAIPVCIAVRLLVKTSRISVPKCAAIAFSGFVVVNAWTAVSTSLIYGNPLIRWCGSSGVRAAAWFNVVSGSVMGAYLAVNALLFAWVILSTLSVWTSLARYIINKPYIREIVMESPQVKEVQPKPMVKKESKELVETIEPKPRHEPRPIVVDDPPAVKVSREPVRREFGEDELPKYTMPSPSVLKDHSEDVHKVSSGEIERNCDVIRTTLADHKVKVNDIAAIPGPTITLYKVFPDRGVSVASIMSRQKDLAVALNVEDVRCEVLKDSVGIEVPNAQRSMVPMKDLVCSEEFRCSDAELPIAIGRTVDRKVKVFDLARAPHLLVAGATQQGKSVGLNVMISSLLFAKHPSELQFVFVDPKGNEFDSYKHLYKHYLAVLPGAENESKEMEDSISVRPEQAEKVLRSLCQEMTERYDLMRAAGSTPNIKTYNQKFKAHKLNPLNGHRLMPYLVAVIDEYADLTMSGSFTQEGRATARNIMTSLILLASKGRAAGIHIIIATQTPRKDVISGVIKANFPTQIAFKVSNNMDSRVIIDSSGAEKLLGYGDMIFSQNARMERIQCGYIGADEINALAKAVETQTGFQKSFSAPYYLPEVQDDEDNGGMGAMVDMKKLDDRFAEAARLVVEMQKASTSYLQTTLEMGFARSARVMSQLEAAGIVGRADGAKPREVLVKDFAELDPILKSFTSK